MYYRWQYYGYLIFDENLNWLERLNKTNLIDAICGKLVACTMAGW